jgi:C-methyltransferase
MPDPEYRPLPAPSSLELSPTPFPTPPPRWLVRSVLWLRRIVERMGNALVPPELWVFERAMDAGFFQVLNALVRAGVLDALAEGPLAASELAAATELDEDVLSRSLRACSHKGFLRKRGDGRFEHNARSRALTRGRLSRLREFLLYFGSGSNQAAWSQFEHALRTGGSPFDHVHGCSIWDWFERHAEERELFAHAMLGISTAGAPVVARAFTFAPGTSVCDVGGGRGTVLSELLIRQPGLRGILYESPSVLALARPVFEARGVMSRVELVAGNFFESVPAGADVYLLKNVLHDWDDSTCRKILANVRAGISASARLLVAEALLEPGSSSTLALAGDLQMLVACSGGRERALSEFEALLSATGFQLGRVHRYPTLSVLEGRPV